MNSPWRRAGGWVRLAGWEKQFGVFAGVSSRSLGNMKDLANFERRLRDAGLDPARWAGGQQVHGRRVVAVARPRLKEKPRTDGLITRSPGLTLRVFTADCVPVFLMDPVRRAIGLVHAGWRGVRAGIVSKAIKELGRCYQTRPADVHAAFGPHIGKCCFEVGPDVAGFFKEIRGAVAGRRLDLSAVLRAQLIDAGVSGRHMTAAPGCTACDAIYFSYRRDQTEKRQAAFLCLKRPPFGAPSPERGRKQRFSLSSGERAG